MGRLFDLVEEYRARYAPHEPSYSRVAEQVGVSRQTLLNWREPTKLLDKEHLIALSKVTGAPYSRVLDALIEDIGYLRPGDPVPVSARRKAKHKRDYDLAANETDEMQQRPGEPEDD